MPKFTSFVENSLLSGADSLKKQQLNLNKCLPTNFIGRLHIVKFSPQQVVIVAPTSAWANKARYYIPSIQKSLMVSSVKIRTMPAAFAEDKPSPAAKATPKKLSKIAKQSLTNCAQIIESPELKQALQNLLKNVEAES